MSDSEPYNTYDTQDSTSSFRCVSTPTYIGYWWVIEGRIKILTEIKPSLWRRFWFSFFFGIEWREQRN